MTIVRVCARHYLPYISTYGSCLLLLFAIPALSDSAPPSSQSHEFIHSGANTTKLFTSRKTFIVRVSAAACAAVSMTASFIAFYWFGRMEKRFRHRLIMILIFGDAMKATWLFIFAVTSIAKCTIETKSLFCQASGFLIQYGTETSDYAVLVMALHSAVQVYRPAASASNDGLYPYRACVYAGALLIPATMAGLAFINPHWGYMSQGAFCSLPIRPLWYRLALAWIPRYVIAIVIVSLAIAIYAHVGWEFRSFTSFSETGRRSMSTTTPRYSAGEMDEGPMGETSNAHQFGMQYAPTQGRGSSVAHSIAASRHASQVVSMTEATVSLPELFHRNSQSQSAPTGPPRTSVQISTGHRNSGISLSPFHTRNSIVRSKECLALQPDMENYPPATASENASPLSDCPTSSAQRQMVQERARIHKQLRLIFIYPLVYVLMWMIPFVNHCMNYSDYWASQPLWGLTLSSTICVTLMGTVDCLIFSLRERPWRHIPASDGSFFGSFVVWRRLSTSSQGGLRRPTDTLQRLHTETNPETPHIEATNRASASNIFGGSLPNLLPGIGSRVRRTSNQKTAAEMARIRLEFEKEDRRRQLDQEHGCRGSVPGLHTIESPGDEAERESHDDEKSAEMDQDSPT